MAQALHLFPILGPVTATLVLFALICAPPAYAVTIVLHPSDVGGDCDEPFESVANALQPGDTLILTHGVYSQACTRAITVRGTRERPITIRAARGARPTLTRPQGDMDRHNNLEIVDSAHLIVRGLRFFGGSIGVRFIGGHDIVFENNEVSATGASAVTLNSGDATRIVLRNNHIHHSGRSRRGATTGEGIYVGCNRARCRVTDSLIEGNRIHDLRATARGGNDGIEVKPGSGGIRIAHNVVHDTVDGREFPCIFVYGGGDAPNVVEYNRLSRCGEAIQVVADAHVRFNTVHDARIAGIVSEPHAQLGAPRNLIVEGNTVSGHPVCARLDWANARNVSLLDNTFLCPDTTAIEARGLHQARVRGNLFSGRSNVRHDGLQAVRNE